MRSLVCCLLLLSIFGCKKGYDPALMGKLTAPEQQMVGKYILETDFTGEGAKEMKQLFDLLASLETGETMLECFPDKTYTMTVGETPVTGDWEVKDTTARLRIRKVGDMKPEEIAKIDLKNQGISGFNMSVQQREEFLKAYSNSLALERAESMATMRVSPDGTLYGISGSNEGTLFAGLVTFFKKQPK